MLVRLTPRRLGWQPLIAFWLLAVAGLACQPATLGKEELLGTASAGDAVTGAEISGADVAADAESGDVLSPDVVAPAGDTPDATVQEVSDTLAEVDGSECQLDAECTAKATSCQKASCSAGKCVLTNLPATAACTDDDPCTFGDSCDASGVCKPGSKPADCDDKDSCTADSCTPKVGCKHDPKDGGSCKDVAGCTRTCVAGQCVGSSSDCQCTADEQCDQGNVCLGPQVCEKAKLPFKCKPAGIVDKCPDPDPNDCVSLTCNPDDPINPCKSSPKADGAVCSDDISCTVGDKCKAGVCLPLQNNCECMTDQECIEINDGVGKLCTGKWKCDLAAGHVCKQIPPPKCNTSDDNACVVTTCDETTGKCKPVPIKQSPIPCNDGNGCTTGDVCEKLPGNIFTGTCLSGTNTCKCTSDADCAGKEDGDMCNGTLFCNITAGECQLNAATIVTCPTALDSVCLKTLCNKKTGVCESVPTERLKTACPVDEPDCGVYVKLAEDETPVVKPCDDDNVCTASSSCKSGQCVTEKTSFICGCAKDADCATLGDKCGGTFICDKTSGKCELNPATVVICPTVGNSQCAKNVCDMSTGKCVMTPLDKGTSYVACEDGNMCTKFDGCVGGQCISGPNTCACKADADCVNWDDGDPCNGTMYCNKVTGQCLNNPATVVYCTPAFDTPCAENKCQPATGTCEMVAKSNATVCDDGNPCTQGDVCIDGLCESGAFTCTCTNNADCAKEEDSDLCNGTLYCDMTKVPFSCKVNPATKVLCPGAQDTPCLKNTCDKLSGKCSMQPNPQLYASCDDGNACTQNDVCIAGECKSGTNTCQCVLDADCLKFDDGNDCNGKLACLGDASAKICGVNPVSVINCIGGSECSKNTCDPSTSSCKVVTVAEACNDNNPCTSDACDGSLCSHAKVVDNTPCSVGPNPKVCLQGACVVKL